MVNISPAYSKRWKENIYQIKENYFGTVVGCLLYYLYNRVSANYQVLSLAKIKFSIFHISRILLKVELESLNWAWKPILFAAMYLQWQLSMIQLRVLQHTKLNRMNRSWNICRNSSEYVTFHAKQKFHEIHISTIQMRWTCRVSLKRHKNKIDLMFFFKQRACVWRILLIWCWKRTDAQNPTSSFYF